MTVHIEKEIDQLRSFHRGELAAIASYRRALDAVREADLRNGLLEAMTSHSERARLLERRIRAMGGEPDKTAGLWGHMAEMMEGGAKILGPQAAMTALFEGEKHGVADYSRDLRKLSDDNRLLVNQAILPEQRRTEKMAGSLMELAAQHAHAGS